MEKSQRDYYLNEQVKAIQKELGEGEDSELDDLDKKIANAGMSSEAFEKAKSEVKKTQINVSNVR
jgi:ATP-dependent Lon protease